MASEKDDENSKSGNFITKHPWAFAGYVLLFLVMIAFLIWGLFTFKTLLG